MQNFELARLFYEMATLLEVEGESRFRVRAYERAAWLAPGQSVTLHKSTTLPTTAGALTNVGTATGADRLGKKVSAHDDAVVTVVLAIRLPRTGSDTGLPLETGFALLGIGFVFIGIARKRHSIEDEIEASDS